jgi:hypothetical protein
MSDGGCRFDRAQGRLHFRDPRIRLQVIKPRQRNRGEDAENDDDHDQFNHGEARFQSGVSGEGGIFLLLHGDLLWEK